MNKIFKVKRNSAGQSVVTSEIAKSRTKGRIIGSSLAVAIVGMMASGGASALTAMEGAKDVGDGYLAVGYESQAIAHGSVVIGANSTANKDGGQTYVLGSANTIDASSSFIAGSDFNDAKGDRLYLIGRGRGSQINGSQIYAFGESNTVASGEDGEPAVTRSYILGLNNTIKPLKERGSYQQYIFGEHNEAAGIHNYLAGAQNKVSGHGNVVLGQVNFADDSGNAFIAGLNNHSRNSVNSSTTMGYGNQNYSDLSTAIGVTNRVAYPWDENYPRSNDELVTYVERLKQEYSHDQRMVDAFDSTMASDLSFEKKLGDISNILGAYSVALGSHNSVGATYSSAIGTQAMTKGVGSVAIGTLAGHGASHYFGTEDSTQIKPQKQQKLKAHFDVANIDENKTDVHVYTLATGAGSIALGGATTQGTARHSIAAGVAAVTKGEDSVAIGFGSTAEHEDSIALGTFANANIDKGVTGYLADGKTDATWQSTLAAMAVGDAEAGHTRQITGLSAGTQDTDAVNVAQLKVVKDLVDTKADKTYVDAELAKKADKADLQALKENITTSIQPALDSKADKADLDALNDAAVKYDGADKSTVTLAGKDGTTITNVKNGALNATSKDAVNGSQLYATNEVLKTKADKAYVDAQDALINSRIDGLDAAVANQGMVVDRLSDRIDNLDDEIRVGLAKQAALAGLFQPYTIGKGNASFAVGGYGTEVAVALGAGYRFDEKWAVKAGFSTGLNSGDGHRASYNVGVNYEW